ncbi:MAG: phosphomethylpyrimidine synthase ThiC [Thermodesulfobacteriota bacterium]|nr:phosphomethylpyrimidine synthase ThiC [Thermodesulfobacteriota bacterium]
MTQLADARKKIITDEMKSCALDENLEAEFIRQGISDGNIIITQNKNHRFIKPLAIGKGLRTKINANIGTSKDHMDVNEELEKMRVSIKMGADTIMDLSTGGEVDEIRKKIINECTVPIGTVPIYQAAVETVQQKKKSIVHMTADDIFRVIEKHAEDGVDFVTVHCGVTRESVARLKKEGRIMDVVSRGGAFLVEWMAYNDKENPLFEHYDRLLEIAKAYDLTLSLGDGLRPGSLADATDRGQLQELILLGELTERAWVECVQVMIEGPGHVPLQEIEANVLLEKKLCHGAPFYVLGPLVTDIAPGYDHITSAIGGAIAASAGADFLCYVTPSEHLGLPSIDDVREGVVASRIAAHAADIAKGVKGAIDLDNKMAKSRKGLDWEGQINLSLDPEKARSIRGSKKPENDDVCTMCGEYCAIKVSGRGLKES